MNDIQQIRDAYKLGFFHGAYAVLQYAKYRIENHKMLKNNRKSQRKVAKLMHIIKNMVKDVVKTKVAGDYDKPKYCIYCNNNMGSGDTMCFTIPTRYGEYDIYMIKPKPQYYDTEKEAMNGLFELRQKLTLEIIRKCKRQIYNEKLQKL